MLLTFDWNWLTSDAFYTLCTIVLGALVYLGRKWAILLKVRDALKLYVPIAYDVVNDIAQHTETEIDDKIAEINRRLVVEEDLLISQYTKANEALAQLEYLQSTLSNSSTKT